MNIYEVLVAIKHDDSFKNSRSLIIYLFSAILRSEYDRIF